MVERREAFQPRPAPTPRPAVVEAGQRPKLWVIGIDSATLDAILPLAGQGRLPFLATVLQSGAYGRLELDLPTRRDALWTTLATGKYPFKHGITGRRPYPAPFLAPGAELRLLPTGIPFSAGACWAPGRCRRARRGARRWRSGRSCRGSAFPPAWSAGRRPPEAGEATFALGEDVFSGDPDPDLRRQTTALRLAAENPRVEAVFLLLPGLREVSRRWFGGFNAVQFEGRQEAEAARAAADRVADYYRRLDGFLAAAWEGGDGPRLLAVVSPYGVTPRGG